MLRPMQWHACHTLWAASVAMSALRSANASWSAEHLQVLDLSLAQSQHEHLSGTIPTAVVSGSKMWKLKLQQHVLHGSIPPAVGFMTAMRMFNVQHNSLRGPVPDAVGSMTAIFLLSLQQNRFGGRIPDAIGSMMAMRFFHLEQNVLRGPIPDAVGSMTKVLHEVYLNENSMHGLLPPAIGLMTTMQFFDVAHNSLRGSIPPVVGSIVKLRSFRVSMNSLCGPIPDAVGSMIAVLVFDVSHNSLSGKIPCGMVSWAKLKSLALGDNGLSGPLPQALEYKTNMDWLYVERNTLSGTIPAAWTCPGLTPVFSAHGNQFAGSIPSGMMRSHNAKNLKVLIHGNRLTGTLPVLKGVVLLTASGNLLEGRLPGTISSQLAMLDLSGVPGRGGGMNGPLPQALCQASDLKVMTMANQQMDGGIPSFTSSLSILALFKNRLNILPEIHFENNVLKTAILLHDNLLSCSIPACDNVAARASLIAIGNRLRYPKGEFPAWVLKYEHDPLFWVSGTDGTCLMLKTSGVVGLFMLVVFWKLGSTQLLRVMSGWQIGPATHLWIVKAMAHVHACLVMAVLLAVVFFMFLLSWDLFACPQTLVLASACLRSSALIRTLVFVSWCKLSVHSPAVEHLTTKAENQSKGTARIAMKQFLLWLLWCGLTVVLSTVTILYQVGKSVPGSLQTGKLLSLGLMVCVGGAQGFILINIVPYLASRMTLQKHVCTIVSSLLMSCVMPGMVIIYLDTGS